MIMRKDTHYAEGTLMPLLVNRLIFSVVPDRSPLLIRPVVRMVFNMLIAQMVEPRLQLNSDMVCLSPIHFRGRLNDGTL